MTSTRPNIRSDVYTLCVEAEESIWQGVAVTSCKGMHKNDQGWNSMIAWYIQLLDELDEDGTR